MKYKLIMAILLIVSVAAACTKQVTSKPVNSKNVQNLDDTLKRPPRDGHGG